MATRLFVGNLPVNTLETDLRTAFSSYGEIKNLDLKSKSTAGDEDKKFAFVTLFGTNYNIESCIKYFSNEDFNGNRLYVTRARESFLERLQRERQEALQKEAEKSNAHETPLEYAREKPIVIKLGDKLNPRKRKIENDTSTTHRTVEHARTVEHKNAIYNGDKSEPKRPANFEPVDKKKQDSEMKRMEAMKNKRKEFKQKQMIVRTGLTSVDKVLNKKIKFSDDEENIPQAVSRVQKSTKPDKRNTLFDEDDENEDIADEVNFKIKKQFEGKKGQKVLDLQSRYKSDKRFVLDERFIEEDDEAGAKGQETDEEDQIEVNQADEKSKQLNILQDVLGIEIKRKIPEDARDFKKNKPKIGMLRFDPSQPDHAKFLAPVEDTKESMKKSKKKTKDREEMEVQERRQEEPRPEVSKEQFYKVSETLKETIAQPSSFRLRSLFGNTVTAQEDVKEEANYISIVNPKKTKVKNPLEPGERNPFIYDSSDSETEEVEETKTEIASVPTETKAVWKESFFFGASDLRFQEGLAFFTSSNDTEARKERRELKSLMKKRIYNKERKNQMQMFQKKIGGRKKTMKKSFRKN